jgi:hypothetical protein
MIFGLSKGCGSAVCIVTSGGLDNLGIGVLVGPRIFHFSIVSRSALGHEADQCPPASAEVKHRGITFLYLFVKIVVALKVNMCRVAAHEDI